MSGLTWTLHVDRPCRVFAPATQTPPATTSGQGRSDPSPTTVSSPACWWWRCSICTPDPCPYTGSASSWASAQDAADTHMRCEHPRRDEDGRHVADVEYRNVSRESRAGSDVESLLSTARGHLIPFPRRPYDSAADVAATAPPSSAPSDLRSDAPAGGIAAGNLTWRFAA